MVSTTPITSAQWSSRKTLKAVKFGNWPPRGSVADENVIMTVDGNVSAPKRTKNENQVAQDCSRLHTTAWFHIEAW